MPPKRVAESEDSDDGVDTSTASSETSGATESRSTIVTACPDTILSNRPNDERHPVADSRPVKTPSDHQTRPSDYRALLSGQQQQQQSESKDDKGAPQPVPIQRLGPNAEVLLNKSNDVYVPVLDEQHMLDVPQVSTPRSKSNTGASTVPDPLGVVLRNAPHDEAIAVSSNETSVGTPNVRRNVNRMRPPEETTDEDEEKEEDDDDTDSRSRGFSNQRPDAIVSEPVSTVIPNLEYKPQEYAKINATASVEMQELFNRIVNYQPSIPDIPAKLRPFIPDYIPSVGDLDPFCKVPRPDGRPDGLGIYVLDEPSVTQSNPAVVLLELRATNIHSSSGLAEVVDSFEDAANRPEVIDRWIADVKKVHYKKPLPTINYQKPMPEIETLLQVWPQGFEDFLNSDVQFPPPHIDMDLDQYVRTLCAILDIPTYSSLIDSLHVMFTLYQEFRANQHFQHE